MVFSSVPAYLDPPNWQQQQPGGGGDLENPQLPPLLPPPPLVGGVEGGTGRPGSMSERARLAKLPRPETTLKCPRCESTNTKFCYFNNYSLTQPRHFCKTCRRYWTGGGALRNVPVGGGCRRNKKSKASSRSKSPATTSSTSTTSAVSPNSCTTDIIGHLVPPQPHLAFLPSLHHLSEYGVAGDIGLTFGGMQIGSGAGNDIDLIQIGTNYSINKFAEQWRMQQVQQFPFLEAPAAGIYQFEGEGLSNYAGGAAADHFGSKPLDSGVTQVGEVKMEGSQQALSLSRNFLGVSGNDQFWGNAWSDLSGFASSSTSHLL